MDKDKETLDKIRELLEERSGGQQKNRRFGDLITPDIFCRLFGGDKEAGWKEKAGIETVESDGAREYYGNGSRLLKVKNRTYGFAWKGKLPEHGMHGWEETFSSIKTFLFVIELVAFLICAERRGAHDLEKEPGSAFEIIDGEGGVFELYTDKSFINETRRRVDSCVNGLARTNSVEYKNLSMKYTFQLRKPWDLRIDYENELIIISSRFAFACLYSDMEKIPKTSWDLIPDFEKNNGL